MDLYLAPRAGIWCRSLSGWDAFCAALAAGREPEIRRPEPVPELLPAREGRRAPLYVRLGIEAGVQACRENAVPLADVATVFASAAGDIQITDYMCRTLAAPAPMLSPTRFHNSVHNAASGYWSIGAANRRASSAIAAGPCTFPVALAEAAMLACCEQAMVLVIAHDVAAAVPIDAVTPNRQPFAAGLLLAARRMSPDWRPLSIEILPRQVPWPVAGAAWLRELVEQNDSARSLPLFEALAGSAPFPVTLPLAAATSLRIARTG